MLLIAESGNGSQGASAIGASFSYIVIASCPAIGGGLAAGSRSEKHKKSTPIK